MPTLLNVTKRLDYSGGDERNQMGINGVNCGLSKMEWT